jgi:translation initiation factor 2 alpha subunit (eIF-2alpha)
MDVDISMYDVFYNTKSTTMGKWKTNQDITKLIYICVPTDVNSARI